MIFDNSLMLSDRQPVTASTASTNNIDWQALGRPYGWASDPQVPDRGEGFEMIPMFVRVMQGFNNLTSLEVRVEVDDNPSFTSPKSVASSGPVGLASLVLGYEFKMHGRIPNGVDERYMRLFYAVVGTAPTLGTIMAGITAGNQSNQR